MNFLSIDVGSTACKCQLFSEAGEILCYEREEYPLLKEGAETYVNVDAIRQTVQKLIAAARRAGEVSSVAVSSFGESFVLLDKEDNVLFPPMLYTDPRGEEEAEQMQKIFGDAELFARTGTFPQSLFSVPKLMYIKGHYPEIFAKADKALLICDYIGYLLTGERVIDYALASRTGAFRVKDKCFDEEILDTLGIPLSLFSTPRPTGTVVGTVKGYGIDGAKLVLGSHDQICSALGAGVVRAGESVDGLGTVECITAVFEGQKTDPAMGRCGYVCVPYAVEGLYCTYMLNYSSGSTVAWLKEGLMHGYTGGKKNAFAYLDGGVGTQPSGILTLPYFGGASTPYQNIGAKGAVIGLSTRTTDADLYRSILEGTAMEMRLNAEVVRKYGIRITRAVATGGGANSDAWLQIKADIQNIRITTLRSAEGGLCGCAMIQAVAMGTAPDLAAAAKVFARTDKTFLPDKAAHAAYENQYRKYKKIYKTVKEFF